MAGWLETAAATLDVSPLTPAEIDALLDATRDIAHTTERRYAPLTAYLLGVVAGARTDRPTALRDAIGRLQDELPQPE